MESCITTKFAGRMSVGSTHPTTLLKEGQFHTRRRGTEEPRTVLACGLACSEIVSGRNLAKVLKPGFEYEKEVLEALEKDEPAPPLAIHTSAGVPEALGGFIEALRPHLPWGWDGGEEEDDWFVSLQVEGASAVLASIDLMLQLRHFRKSEDGHSVASLCDWKVGVGAVSYHGPPSSSPGSNIPLFSHKHNQVLYPVPPREEQGQEKYLLEFESWLEDIHHSLGCLLVEPQWGSTAAASCWHPETLRKVIEMCHEKNVLVVADEIMCGLGRHGNIIRLGNNSIRHTMFLSEAWKLPVDAVTFGKAICAGAYPMSGVLCRGGARKLESLGRSVLQSHTYSGSNVRALMTATEVLKMLPSLLPGVVERGSFLGAQMKFIESNSEGLFVVQGQGLMWGALLNKAHPLASDASAAIRILKSCCENNQVLPYFVPVGGFMVTPLFDVDIAVISQIGTRLLAAIQAAIVALKKTVI